VHHIIATFPAGAALLPAKSGTLHRARHFPCIRGSIKNRRSIAMRKIIPMLALAAAAAVATPALAAPRYSYRHHNGAVTAAEVGTGAVAGTVVGLGFSEGWWGPAVGGTIFPTTAAGAATVGGVAGIGTVALLDAAIQPCRGFQALLGMNKDACVNGEYVGYEQAPPPQRAYRR